MRSRRTRSCSGSTHIDGVLAGCCRGHPRSCSTPHACGQIPPRCRCEGWRTAKRRFGTREGGSLRFEVWTGGSLCSMTNCLGEFGVEVGRRASSICTRIPTDHRSGSVGSEGSILIVSNADSERLSLLRAMDGQEDARTRDLRAKVVDSVDIAVVFAPRRKLAIQLDAHEFARFSLDGADETHQTVHVAGHRHRISHLQIAGEVVHAGRCSLLRGGRDIQLLQTGLAIDILRRLAEGWRARGAKGRTRQTGAQIATSGCLQRHDSGLY